MTMIAAASISAGGSILGGLLGGSAAKKAAKAQLQAAREANALQERMFNQQIALQEPFRQAGLTTQAELLRRFGLGGDAATPGYGNLLKDFSQEDFIADPGYAFRLSEGLKALDRTAAMRGKMMSGQALKAAGRYGQDMASQEYQNAYGRFMGNKASNYNMLTGQQAVGQNATNQQGQATGNYSQQAGENLMGMGNARASAYIGQANAFSNALQGAGNSFMQAQMLNKMYPSPGVSGTSNPYVNPSSNSMFNRVMGGG